MKDLYVEQIVNANRDKKTGNLQKLFIALAALFAAVALLIHIGAIVLCIAAAVAAGYLGNKQSFEYEYIFVNGQLDVDVVKTNRRKRLVEYQMEQLVCMVPVESPRMDGYKNNCKKHIKAFTGSTKQPVYALMFKGEDGYVRVDLEPEEELMKAFKVTVPHKILA